MEEKRKIKQNLICDLLSLLPGSIQVKLEKEVDIKQEKDYRNTIETVIFSQAKSEYETENPNDVKNSIERQENNDKFKVEDCFSTEVNSVADCRTYNHCVNNEAVKTEASTSADEFGNDIHQTTCMKTFTNKARFMCHNGEQQRRGEQYRCTSCNVKLQSAKSFTDHFRTCQFRPMQKQIFPCHICGKQFPKKFSLDRHIENAHKVTQNIRHKCNLCGKEFRTQRILNFHVSTHQELWQECGICKRPFRKATDLKKHMLTHDNKIPYFCITCKLGFVEKNKFKKHKKDFHKQSKKNNIKYLKNQ